MWLKQTDSGSWRVIVQRKGQKLTGTAATRDEAQELGAQLLLSLGGTRPSRKVTVGELLAAWLAESKLSVTYRADVQSALHQHLPDGFKRREVGEIGTPAIHALYTSLTARGVSPHRVRRIHGALRSAWKLALREGWATADPTDKAKLPHLETAEVVPPDTAVVGQLLAGLERKPQLGLFLRLAATTGARRGELVALQWPDIGDRHVTIRRSIGQVPGAIEIRGTKTGVKGHRTIAVGRTLIEQLEHEHDRQRLSAITDHGAVAEPVWVFSADAGVSHWRPDYPTQMFVKLKKSLGIEGVKLHGMRHFVATRLLDAGEQPSTVAHRLGHSTTATTLRTYAHYVKASDQRAAETIENLIGS